MNSLVIEIKYENGQKETIDFRVYKNSRLINDLMFNDTILSIKLFKKKD